MNKIKMICASLFSIMNKLGLEVVKILATRRYNLVDLLALFKFWEMIFKGFTIHGVILIGLFIIVSAQLEQAVKYEKDKHG